MHNIIITIKISYYIFHYAYKYKEKATYKDKCLKLL